MEINNEIKVLDKGFVRLEGVLSTDSDIADSARISHLGKSRGEGSDEKLIGFLISHKHTSPFEQAELRFLVKAPIFVARQWMRHRTWSYAEVSRRYTDEEIDFYIPEFENRVEKNVYEVAIAEAINAYNTLLNLNVRKEISRGVLPVSLYTMFYAKTDLHNLLHFLELRRAPDAQYEIREYAIAIEEVLKEKFPITYEAWNCFLTK